MFSQQIFSVRNDLIISQIRQGESICWVVKDPITRKFFYFNEQEYAILAWLDGTCTVETIVTRFCRKFAPLHLTVQQLSLFLSQLAQSDLLKGLTTTPTTGQDNQLSHRLIKTVSNPLAIRLPGVNPSRFLDWVYPYCRWIYSTPAFVSWGLLILTAISCVIVRFDDFVTSIPRLETWGTAQVLFTVAGIVFLTKVIHELAHALTARHYGARCESIGVLLLIFTPCLYCDVSDAWLLASRRARIAISAAGIFAELIIASLAAILWMFSVDEFTKTILASVIVVCSISTAMFNGNPLMRYDGYFILSDLIRMPNLAGEATALITTRLRQWIWGEETVNGRRSSFRRQTVLWIYGVLSQGYRLLLTTLILYGVYRFLDERNLGLVGALFALFTIVTLVRQFSFSLLRPPRGMPLQGRSAGRPLFAAGCLAFLLAVIAFVPVPLRLDAPFRIESRESRDVFIPVAGLLTYSVSSGEKVQKGDTLAELKNPAIDLELQRVDLQLASLRNRLKSLEARRGLLANADERPVLMESISSLEKKRTVLAREKEELTIRSPLAGVIHEPPNVADNRSDEKSVTFWTGTPLDPSNRSGFLEQGTHLCSVTEEIEKVAVLYLSQRRVRRVAPGQKVRLWVPGIPTNGLNAEVIEISPAPVDEIPREMIAKNAIPMNPSVVAGQPKPHEPIYRVVARFHDDTVPLPLRYTGNGSIRVVPVTLWESLREFVQEAFDF